MEATLTCLELELLIRALAQEDQPPCEPIHNQPVLESLSFGFVL